MKNPIDRLISYLSPVKGMHRARARAMTRVYEGASQGHRASSWRPRGASANTEVGSALVQLRERARELVRNTPHATRMLDIFTDSAIGTGLRPISKTGDSALDKRVIKLWDSWQKCCDIEGVQSFGSIQSLAVRSMIESGEVVFRLIDINTNGKSIQTDGQKIPFRMQLLEADLIDGSREGLWAGGDAAGKDVVRSRMGVGLGKFDARIGLWLLPFHPGELYAANMASPLISEFYRDDDLIHLYKQTRPGQIRGVSWFAPVLVTARDLDDFIDASRVKARVEACYAAFVTNNEDSTLHDVDGSYLEDADITTLEPGMIKQLRMGQDVKFAQPTGVTQFEPMVLHGLMSMAAGLGIPYDALSGDLRQANYSSLRAGGLTFKRHVEAFQEHLLIPRLCEPVWDRFISRAVIAGLLPGEADYKVEWVTPAWEPVNPKVDLTAEQLALRSGRMSPQQYVAQWGYNWREVIDQWKEYNDYADEQGVIFDSMPTKTTRAGSLQPPPGGGGQPGGFTPGGLTDSEGNEITAPEDSNTDGGERVDDLEDLAEEIEQALGQRAATFPDDATHEIKTRDGDFDEDKHPRDPNGEFTDGADSNDGGSGGKDGSGSGSGKSATGSGKSATGSGSGSGGKSGSGSLEQAQAAAKDAASGHASLKGLPSKPIKLGNDWYVPGPIGRAKDAAVAYMRDAGMKYDPPDEYVKVDPERATRIANAFEEMKHDPSDPAVKASYAALAKEVTAQWQAVKATGLKVEWIKPDQADPYADSPRRAAMDVSVNNHWWGFPTSSGFGSDSKESAEAIHDNPMLAPTDEVIDGHQCVVNDLFRIVHDYFGHFKDGNGFRASGEDNAWRSHVAMFSDLAKGAMTSETRGQNSWVNYGPYGATNKKADAEHTHYAPQKVGLLPSWAWDTSTAPSSSKDATPRTDWDKLVHRIHALTRDDGDFDEDKHPRDSNGEFTDGADSNDGGGSDKASSATSSSKSSPAAKSTVPAKTPAATTPPSKSSDDKSPTSKKGKPKAEDFEKAKINVSDVENVSDTWEKNMGDITPDDFKKDFLGGVEATMSIAKTSGGLSIAGNITKNGSRIGNYRREIDFMDKTAESAFFAMDKAYNHSGIGKSVLAGNIAMYQKLGIERVKVHANIDVGGYAWAKYGYVPSSSSWRTLSSKIEGRLEGKSSSSGSGYVPESWEEITESDQEDIRDRWMRDSFDEFFSNEVDNWRENGGALDDAKYSVANDADLGWANDALDEFRTEDDGIPFSNAQILTAIKINYDNNGEGTGDLNVNFDDNKLTDPVDAPSKDQLNLPGIDPTAPHERLTKEMREEITKVITKAFDEKADSDANDINPPDYLGESVGEYQEEYWHNLNDDERYENAQRLGILPEYDLHEEEDDEQDVEPVKAAPSEKDNIIALAKNSNPKSVWAIADSPKGKGLLLGTDWFGELNLKDKEAMDRFTAYVGKGKDDKQAAAV